MKSQAVAVVSVLLLLATLITDGDCQGGGFGGGRGRKREIGVKVISAYNSHCNIT